MNYLVIDGNSILNRAFYGIRLLSNREGVYTNALLGFCNILLKTVEEEQPDGVCVCFDLKAPTFRHKAFVDYKAGRRPMPEELAMQLPLLKELLDAWRIPRFELAGYEADDLLGTLSAKIAAGGDQCVLLTGDRDSYQLIGPGVRLRYASTKNGQSDTVLYDEVKIQLDKGVTPSQLIDVKALMGDASDNIPGVKGIGEKTALELIGKFGSLDGVYENLEDASIRPAVREKLLAHREDAYMSRMLAEIDRDVPLAVTPADLNRREPDNDALYRLLDRLEMQRTIARLKLKRPAAPLGNSDLRGEITLCETENLAPSAALEALAAMGETLAVVADEAFEEFAIASPCRAIQTRAEGADCAALWRALAACELTVHNSKRFYRELAHRDLPAPAFAMDTMLAAYLLNLPTEAEALSERVLGLSLRQDGDDPAGPVGQQGLFDTPDLTRTAQALVHLTPILRENIRAQGQENLLYEVEMPLSQVLAHMERDGFLVDTAALAAFGTRLEARAREIEAVIYLLAGEPFNILSPKQLGHILFEKLRIPGGKKTKTGYSTAADVIKPLAPNYEIIDLVLQYRNLTKLKSTYVDGLLAQVAQDGRIHSNLDQTGTVTGRLSSSEPNLQNIPVRSDPGSELRNMFIARPGNLLVDADYSQIELRILAHIAADDAMREAFANGEDIHRATAAKVYGVAPEAVTHQQRSAAKAVNFGIVYGISDFSLAGDIGVSRREARELMDKYFATYPGVEAYMDAVIAKAREDGYVSTLDGRRRTLPDITSSNFNLRTGAERIARNTPIQGTAADVIKRAMVRVYRRLKAEGLQARLILQVHDELIVEAPEAEAAYVARLLSREMEASADYTVALLAESGTGRTWAEAKQ